MVLKTGALWSVSGAAFVWIVCVLLPEAECEDEDDQHFLLFAHFESPDGVDGQEEDEQVGDGVEQPARVQQHRDVDAFSWDLRVGDLRSRRALEDLDQGRREVEPD